MQMERFWDFQVTPVNLNGKACPSLIPNWTKEHLWREKCGSFLESGNMFMYLCFLRWPTNQVFHRFYLCFVFLCGNCGLVILYTNYVITGPLGLFLKTRWKHRNLGLSLLVLHAHRGEWMQRSLFRWNSTCSMSLETKYYCTEFKFW